MKEINENYFSKSSQEPNKKPKDLLSKNETILWQGRPKKLSYVLANSITMMPIGLIWGVIDFFALFAAFSHGSIDIATSIIIILFFSIHLFPFWIWLASLIKSNNDIKQTYYIITNKRLLVVKGKSAYISGCVEMKDLFGCTCKRGFIDKLLRVGDLYIKGKNSSIVFFDVANSQFISDKIDAINKKEILGSELFNNNHICAHCGQYYSKYSMKCPSCGAPYSEEEN